MPILPNLYFGGLMNTAESENDRSFLIYRFTPENKWITRFIDKIVSIFWSSLPMRSVELRSATIGFQLNNGRSVEISTRGLGLANFKFVLDKLENGEEELSVRFPEPGVLDEVREKRKVLEPIIQFLKEKRIPFAESCIKGAIQSAWAESLGTLPVTTCHEIIDGHLPMILAYIYDANIGISEPMQSVTYMEWKRSVMTHFPGSATITTHINDYAIDADYEFWTGELGSLCKELVLRIRYRGNGDSKSIPVTRVSSKYGLLGNDNRFPFQTMENAKTWVERMRVMFNQAIVKTITDQYDKAMSAIWAAAKEGNREENANQ